MEVEKLVGKLRSTRFEIELMLASMPQECPYPRKLSDDIIDTMSCPIQLDRHRTVATVAKMLVDDKTIPDGERLAGALMQMMGAGDAKPYEVEDNA